jgi:hypothetical protein
MTVKNDDKRNKPDQIPEETPDGNVPEQHGGGGHGGGEIKPPPGSGGTGSGD